MEYREEWAFSRERIERFFREQSDVEEISGGFVFGGCRIRLTGLPQRTLGPVRIPYTYVEMVGDEDDTEQIHRRFFLRFISAGG